MMESLDCADPNLNVAQRVETLTAPQALTLVTPGSVAEGRPTAGSDVDLMVIGSLGLRKLTGLLSDVGLTLGREVNPHVLSRREYRRRLADGDHFVTNVLGGPKLFVIGTENDLATTRLQPLSVHGDHG